MGGAPAPREPEQRRPVPPGPSTFEADLARAVQLHKSKSPETERAYLDMLARYDDDPRVLSNLAVFYRSEARVGDAMACYRRAIAVHEHPHILGNYANLCSESGDWANAVTAYARALELDPDNLGLLFSSGQLQMKRHLWGECEATMNRILKMKPGHPGAVRMLAEIKYNLDLVNAARSNVFPPAAERIDLQDTAFLRYVAPAQQRDTFPVPVRFAVPELTAVTPGRAAPLPGTIPRAVEEAALAQAKLADREGRYLDAVAIFEQALQTGESTKIRLRLAAALTLIGRIGDAREVLQATGMRVQSTVPTEVLKPSLAPAPAGLGYRLGRLSRAIGYFLVKRELSRLQASSMRLVEDGAATSWRTGDRPIRPGLARWLALLATPLRAQRVEKRSEKPLPEQIYTFR